MTRALDATQAELVRRSHIAPITLVKLTTFSNRTTNTIDKIFYLANLPVRYDYGNLGTDRDFLPVITGGTEFFSGFSHIPQPDNLTAFEQSIGLEVSNLPINGLPFVLILQAHNLQGAEIEISQLLLDEIGSLPLDLSASHVGDEHTVLFRGRVNRIAPIQEFNFTIQCRADLPSMANEWLYANDDTKVDPIDVGQRLPRVYGKSSRTAVVSFEVGWSGTLVDAIDKSEDNVNKKVSDATGLPGGSFTLRIDSEQITCTKIDALTIKISLNGRAQNSTVAARHEPGAIFIELIATATWIISDKQSDAVNDLYVVNPANGVLLRLDATLTPHSINLSDTTTISG